MREIDYTVLKIVDKGITFLFNGAFINHKKFGNPKLLINIKQ